MSYVHNVLQCCKYIYNSPASLRSSGRPLWVTPPLTPRATDPGRHQEAPGSHDSYTCYMFLYFHVRIVHFIELVDAIRHMCIDCVVIRATIKMLQFRPHNRMKSRMNLLTHPLPVSEKNSVSFSNFRKMNGEQMLEGTYKAQPKY